MVHLTTVLDRRSSTGVLARNRTIEVRDAQEQLASIVERRSAIDPIPIARADLSGDQQTFFTSADVLGVGAR
jgi:hypothetical protein